MDSEFPAPVVLVGFSPGWVGPLGHVLPANGLILIEEADVMRKRDVGPAVAEQPVVREVIEWDYQTDGSADRFFNAHRDLAPSAILPLTEYSVPFAARLSERYGRPGAGFGAAQVMRDKHLLRQVTAAAGIANPRSVPVASASEVHAFMTSVGGPIVLKPANRQGSVGTRIIHETSEIDAAWAQCIQQDEGVMVPDRAVLPLRMLAEEFIQGDEYSVELVLAAGKPVFAGVTRKFLFDGPYPVEQGHLHPAAISAELSSRLIADTERLLEVVGADTAFVHCEWIVRDGTPHLVECAGRMAGDNIIELVITAWSHFAFGDYLKAMQGEPVEPTQPAAPARYAAAWFSAVPHGEIESVDGADEVRALEGVNTVTVPEVGALSGPLRNSYDRKIMVTAMGATPDEAVDLARTAVGRIKVGVRPGPVTAA